MEGEERKEKENNNWGGFYPVAGLECGATTEDLAEILFRQLVSGCTVGGFTTEGPQGERYGCPRSTFWGIIGLDKEKQDEFTTSIGGTMYTTKITSVFAFVRTEGTWVDQQDMMFLANIQNNLDISSLWQEWRGVAWCTKEDPQRSC